MRAYLTCLNILILVLSATYHLHLQMGFASTVIPDDCLEVQSCINCLPGTYASHNSSCRCCKTQGQCPKVTQCTSCPPGYFQPFPGENECILCPKGYFQNFSGQPKCHFCIPGTYCRLKAFKVCRAIGDVSLQVPTVFFEILSSKYCDYSVCWNSHSYFKGKHYFCISGCISCKECPPGFITPSLGSTECFPCPSGFHQPEEGQSFCVKCSAGYDTNETGQSQCTKCKKGYFKNESMTKCEPCPAAWEAKEEAMTNCVPCQPGYFKRSVGEGKCHPCDKGSYVLYEGAKSCLQCPHSYYCPCPDCAPIQCPPDAFCPEGSSHPYCSSPFYVRRGYKCHMSETLLGIIAGMSLVGLLLTFYLFCRSHCNNIHQHVAAEHTPLLQASANHPVYSGL